MITFIIGAALGGGIGYVIGAHKFGALLAEAQLVIAELKTKISQSSK